MKPTNKQELINQLKMSDVYADCSKSLIRKLSKLKITPLSSGGYYELERIGQKEFLLRTYCKKDSWAIKITI